MEDQDRVMQELFSRLEELTRQQKVFQEEIQRIREELVRLKMPPLATGGSEPAPVAGAQFERKGVPLTAPPQPHISPVPSPPVRKTRAPWEDFIGTNLLNKVGIAVLVLGIGFGAKYSIDLDLVSPLWRIVLGYLAGFALITIAIRLRGSHTGFSAVLLSGGMAVLYFITYSAHTFYGLIPQWTAFILMVGFTLCTVYAAVKYNMEVIGIIGLVGAYAVPVVLSDGSGPVLILFSYIAIINCGILVLGFRKYWKRLFYLAFILTWFTFGSWYAFRFDEHDQTAISLIFSTIFFLIFYVTFLAYKLINNEPLTRWDIICMLFNSFVYFGYGYLTVDSLRNGEAYLGLFAVFNALLHFVACIIIYKTQRSHSDVFYFVAGMVVVFLTIAVPVQLEGSWVTLVWAAEAVLMFWVGRVKSYPSYERLSYPLIALAFVSLLQDWGRFYPESVMIANSSDFAVFFNIQFLTSMLVGVALVSVPMMNKRFPRERLSEGDESIAGILDIGIPVLTAFVFYMGFYKEIEAFWNIKYGASRVGVPGEAGYVRYNEDLLNFKGVWLVIYSAIFATVLFLVQWRFFCTKISGTGSYLVNTLVLLAFLAICLPDLSALRSAFLEPDPANLSSRNFGNIMIRYLAIAAVLPLLWFNRKLIQDAVFNIDSRQAAGLFFHLVVLVLISSELIHWLEMARVENSYRLALSVLWGAYALFLIVIGLSRDEKHIRVGAIVLFAVTLIKLFVYDLEEMSTILKTVVMIILGVLLLTASFVYNKYKHSARNETP